MKVILKKTSGKMFDRNQPLHLPKMNSLLKIIAFATISVVIVACVTSNSLYKKGNQLSAAGMNKEAAQFFYNSLNKNANNIDSRIALKGIAQKVFEEDLQKFYQAHGADQFKEAVYSYRSAIAYKENREELQESKNIINGLQKQIAALQETISTLNTRIEQDALNKNQNVILFSSIVKDAKIRYGAIELLNKKFYLVKKCCGINGNINLSCLFRGLFNDQISIFNHP